MLPMNLDKWFTIDIEYKSIFGDEYPRSNFRV